MLQDAIAGALPDLRAEAEARMVSTCTIGEPGDPVTDPETGEVTHPLVDVTYSGICRVRPATLQAQSRQMGGAEAFVSDVLVSLPATATGIRKGMLVTVDSSPDADLVGLRAEIQDAGRGDSLTARRMWCLEVS
jgi:S1-C subfamily serine protease